jgi:methylsterol monooxygenase
MWVSPPGTPMLIIAVYWIFGGIYTLLDITNKPAVLRKYKIQPGTNEPVDPKRLMQASTQCLFLRHVYFNTKPIEIVTAHLLSISSNWLWGAPILLSRGTRDKAV